MTIEITSFETMDVLNQVTQTATKENAKFSWKKENVNNFARKLVDIWTF